jgi:hypothetical protein
MPSNNNGPGGNKYFAVERISYMDSRRTTIILLTILAVGLLSVYLNPFEPFFNDVLGIQSVNGCPLLTFAGIPCPMCGMGRVFSCMTDFYIARSFYYNPLGLVFYLIFGFVFCVILGLSLNKRKLILKKPAQKLWYIPVLFVVLMWILNILYGHHHE